MTEFEAKADIDNEDTEVFIRIPHGSWKRIVAGFMAGVTFILGIFSLPGKVNQSLQKGEDPTEVQK
jgi:hypothetical protein